MQLQVLVTVGVRATVRARPRELGDLAGRTAFGWVAASEVSLVEGEASWCLGVREGIDPLALDVAKTKVGEDEATGIRSWEWAAQVGNFFRVQASYFNDA